MKHLGHVTYRDSTGKRLVESASFSDVADALRTYDAAKQDEQDFG